MSALNFCDGGRVSLWRSTKEELVQELQFKLSNVSLLPNALPSLINSKWRESYYTPKLFLFHNHNIVRALESSDCIITSHLNTSHRRMSICNTC